MDGTILAAAFLATLLVALIYSSVGQAGASGYIAVLALLGFPATEIKPTALVLNVLVATIGAIQFGRAGHFSWKLFWPLALLSVPGAFLGGYLTLPAEAFKLLVGAVLVGSALWLLFRHRAPETTQPPPLGLALASGGMIGLLSGLTATGGGIFLTPLLLFARWATIQQAAAVAALFVLVNSAAAIAGHVTSGQGIPPSAGVLAVAAGIGGTIGSYLGSRRRLPPRATHLLLAVVLLVAGIKLLVG